ncbi:hypothetical protein [Sulfurisphaera ohwakuensis]|uniref:hypothetical protein n=1 Tax=Sulfurisphaera ohwakuensis TaxID=69656 RepID=UPI0036F1C7A9
MKGLSNVVAAMLILLIIIILALSTAVTLELENAEYSTSEYVIQNYEYFHDLVDTQLKNDILNVSYYAFPITNGYCIELTFRLNPNVESSGPYVINISSIIAYTSNGLVLVNNKYPIQVLISSSPYTITFQYASAPDLYIILQNGIAVFLPPNSSV